MWGEEDQIIDLSAVEVWRQGLPDAEVITYPGVGHMPMLEVPEKSAADYLDFLRKQFE